MKRTGPSRDGRTGRGESLFPLDTGVTARSAARPTMMLREMTNPDPFAEAARQLQTNLETNLTAHATVKASKRYQDAQKHLSRLVADFAMTVQLSAFYFTRNPHAREWMLWANADDFLESAVAIPVLVEQGIFNSARREMRYLLEALVKFVYVDQQLPNDAPLQDRLTLLADNAKVPRSSVDPIDWMTLRLVPQPEEFRGAVKQAFKSLSGYVHPSRSQIDERLRRATRGEFSGFEGPTVVEAFNRLTSQTLDLAVVLICEGIGPAFTGDLYVHLFDDYPGWKFHRTRFAAQVSRYFDYKVERQQGDDTAARRPGRGQGPEADGLVAQ